MTLREAEIQNDGERGMTTQEVRSLLTPRKLVQSKLLDVLMSLRGLLRGFGPEVGLTTPSRFAGRLALQIGLR
jgi:transposase